MLVLPDEHAQAAVELCQLQQQPGGDAPVPVPATTAASVVRLVGVVLRYLRLRTEAEAAGPGSRAALTFATAYVPLATARVVLLARRLLSLAVAVRWPAVSALLLPAATADGRCSPAAVLQLDALAGPAPSLLHLAVASGCASTTGLLLDWSGGPEGPAALAAADAPPLLEVAAALGGGLTLDLVQVLAGESTRMAGSTLPVSVCAAHVDRI